jgi:primosomal protein N' (replication factor Y)
VTVDHLFALPGFRVRERLMRLLFELKAVSQEKVIIQTRLAADQLWQYFESGTIAEFYRREISERQEAGYPPFSILVKITRIGTEESVQRDLDRLVRLLAAYEPVVYPAWTQGKGKYIAHALIKVPIAKWQEPELSAVLSALPPIFIINVEPADIL